MIMHVPFSPSDMMVWISVAEIRENRISCLKTQVSHSMFSAGTSATPATKLLPKLSIPKTMINGMLNRFTCMKNTQLQIKNHKSKMNQPGRWGLGPMHSMNLHNQRAGGRAKAICSRHFPGRRLFSAFYISYMN
jgi:hypothetical protein